MNPISIYEFRSAKGITIEVSSRLGEDSARSHAMYSIYGQPYSPFFNIGTGLHLISVRDVEAT